ncbi:MAG: hypothetical protein R3C49_17305 [Planctomycetaceae bacterium]
MNQVLLSAGSRLHFGLLCAAEEQRWHYGGVGLMIDQPAWQLHVGFNPDGGPEDIIHPASDSVIERSRALLKVYRDQNPELPSLQVSVHQEVPFHCGLGAGTQLTLALATACDLLLGRPRAATAAQTAERFGRSRRSAIGTFGFDHGGFIIDEGRTADRLQRLRFPDEWRMVLLIPRQGSGLSGSAEENFFSQRPCLSDSSLQEIEPLVTQRMTSAVTSRNFVVFRDSLLRYGNLVGADYASAQGGIFSHPLIRSVVEKLEQLGFAGAVQSSWGPTTAIPVESQADGERLVSVIRELSGEEQLAVTISRGLNSGVHIRSDCSEDSLHRLV